MSARKILSHFEEFDHWTFLIALGLVCVNIVYRKVFLDLFAGVLLIAALIYDVQEEINK